MRKERAEETDWVALAVAAKYNAAQLAASRGVSLRQLERLFAAEFRMPPKRWLHQLRLSQSQEKLLKGYQIKHVALDLHFKDLSHFHHQFRAHFGCSPGEFLRKHLDTGETWN